MYVLDLEQIAEEVKKAPSIFNSQPWLFKAIADDRIDMYIGDGINLYVSSDNGDEMDPRRADQPPSKNDASRLDPVAREFVISCGAALYNLRLAIRVAGHGLAVRLPPHPTRDSRLLASVEIMTGRIKPPTTTEQELYEAIWRRQTNRWPHTVVSAPLPIIVAMEDAAAQEGASLRLLHPHQAKKWLNLAAEADNFFKEQPTNLSDIALGRYQMHQGYRNSWREDPDEVRTEDPDEVRTEDPDEVRTEDPDEVRTEDPDEVRTGKQDGVPIETFGPTPRDRSPIRKPTRKDFWRPDKKARFERPPRLDKGPFERPQLMVLSTDDDQILDWLRAGQALQHAILTGTRYSVSPPYGVTAKYHAPYRYGLPGRYHLVRRWRRDLAFYGLSVSLLTEPLERYDVIRSDTEPKDSALRDAALRDAALRPRPLPWRYAELPQVVIRVGYAVHPAAVAPRRRERKQIIVDDRPKAGTLAVQSLAPPRTA